MGLLRKKGCYKTKARLFHDSPIEVTLRWFIVPHGTPFLPVTHLWAGRPWRYDRSYPTIGPGELVESKLVWDAGLPPANTLPWLGSDDEWKNGISHKDFLAGKRVQVRPGVCPVFEDCMAADGCDQCGTTSQVWTMDAFPAVGVLQPQVLVQDEGCHWTSSCTNTAVGCPEGTARAWYVALGGKVGPLGDSVITQTLPGTFAAGCCVGA